MGIMENNKGKTKMVKTTMAKTKEIYPIARRTLSPFIMLYIRKVKGLENLSIEGNYIVAANHTSYLDDLIFACLVMTHTNKQLHIYVNSRYYSNWFLRKFLDWAGCIPVFIDKTKEAKEKNNVALKKGEEYLKKKHIVGFFPEGTRSKDGKLKEGKIGVAKLALQAKIPIVPFGIRGTYEILPKGAIFPRFRRCEVSIGIPITVDTNDRKKDKRTHELVTKKVMESLAKLTNQDYSY